MTERSRLVQAPPSRCSAGHGAAWPHRPCTGKELDFSQVGPQRYTFMLLFTATPSSLRLSLLGRILSPHASLIWSLPSQFCQLAKLFTSGFLHTLCLLTQRFCLPVSFSSFGSHHKHSPSQECPSPAVDSRLDPQHISVPHHTLVWSFFIII